MFHYNPKSIIVQKYGGTSVGSVDRIKHVAQRVLDSAKSSPKLAVVVSAMSGETNRLVDLVNQVNPNGNQRNYDMVVAAGEQVSVALLANAIEAIGGKATALLAFQLGINTTNHHGKAKIQDIQFDKIHECWSRGEIPIVAGFQGVTSGLEITTLGRGGSDTSAVALAVALKADFCEINTDVDGVYTADPRVVKQAKLLTELDFETALELASLGSKVLHTRCVELAAKFRLPILVRSTFQPNLLPGTKIMSYNDRQKLEAAVVSGVTLDRDVIRMTVDNIPTDQEAIAKIFSFLADNEVNIDIIIHNQNVDAKNNRIGFTFGSLELNKALEAMKRYELEFAGVQINTTKELAKVSVVGIGMISHPGVAAKLLRSLAAEGIEIYMISTSEIKISCVIDAKLADKAANALHALFLDKL